jgi:hypothetical protein
MRMFIPRYFSRINFDFSIVGILSWHSLSLFLAIIDFSMRVSYIVEGSRLPLARIAFGGGGM